MSTAKSPLFPDFKGFIQIVLTESDITTLDSTEVDVMSLNVWLQTFIRDGYRVQCLYDAESKVYKSTAMDIQVGRTSAGWMLSGEGPDFLSSLMVIWYKHTARMANDWIPFCNQTRQVKKFR